MRGDGFSSFTTVGPSPLTPWQRMGWAGGYQMTARSRPETTDDGRYGEKGAVPYDPACRWSVLVHASFASRRGLSRSSIRVQRRLGHESSMSRCLDAIVIKPCPQKCMDAALLRRSIQQVCPLPSSCIDQRSRAVAFWRRIASRLETARPPSSPPRIDRSTAPGTLPHLHSSKARRATPPRRAYIARLVTTPPDRQRPFGPRPGNASFLSQNSYQPKKSGLPSPMACHHDTVRWTTPHRLTATRNGAKRPGSGTRAGVSEHFTHGGDGACNGVASGRRAAGERWAGRSTPRGIIRGIICRSSGYDGHTLLQKAREETWGARGRRLCNSRLESSTS
jgi:hypothetical protein